MVKDVMEKEKSIGRPHGYWKRAVNGKKKGKLKLYRGFDRGT